MRREYRWQRLSFCWSGLEINGFAWIWEGSKLTNKAVMLMIVAALMGEVENVR